jgi:hypothetical protein
MAGRFRIYTDADIHGPVVDALQHAGWDNLRAIDALPEGTKDAPHFERAASEGRVFVTNDNRVEHQVVSVWLADRRPFAGMIHWPRSHYFEMSPGDFVEAFEELARQDDPFPRDYPVVHLKKKR